MKMGWVLYAILCLSVLRLDCSAMTCGPGEQLKVGENGESDTCEPCPKGFFQPKTSDSWLRGCEKCSVLDDSDGPLKGILIDECTRFHDIVITCPKDRYLTVLNNCELCTNCSKLRSRKHEAQACTERGDAVCCDKPGMMVKNGTCVAPDDFCGGPPGEYVRVGQECISYKHCKLGRIASNTSETQPSGRVDGNISFESKMLYGAFGVLAGVILTYLFRFLEGVILMMFWICCSTKSCQHQKKGINTIA